MGLAQQHRPCAPMHPLSQVQDQLQQQLAGVGQAQHRDVIGDGADLVAHDAVGVDDHQDADELALDA